MRAFSSARRLVLGTFAASTLVQAQSITPDSAQTARLAMLGRIWGTVKYFHPAFLSRDVSWDSAFVAAVPRVITARSSSDYSAAVDDMLRALDDRTTRVRPSALPHADEGRYPAAITMRWEQDSTLVVAIPDFLNNFYEQIRPVIPAVRAARRIVFDLRGRRPSVVGDADDKFGTSLDALLAPGPIAGPAVHLRVQRDFSSPFEWVAQPGEVFRGEANNMVRRVVFLAFADSDMPAIAWALQGTGQGAIVLDSARGTNMNPWSSRSRFHAMEIGEGLTVDIRLSDLVGRRGGVAAPDVITGSAGSADRPLLVALDLARQQAQPRLPTATPASSFIPRADDAYPQPRFPSLPYRLLGGFRYWTAIHYFYPSAMPAGEDWNRALLDVTRAMAQARDSVEYAVAIWTVARRLKDVHAGGMSPPIATLRGAAWPEVKVEYVEGQPVVVGVGRDSALRASGIKVGDVILRVDGEHIPVRKARLDKYSPGTRPEVLDYLFAGNSILSGPLGTTAHVRVRTATGTQREIALPRRGRPCVLGACLLRDGPAYRLLPGNIGYVDLSLLDEAAVDSMFERFRYTPAIIFDGRGYPRSSMYAIIPRLAPRTGTAFAQRRYPQWFSPDTTTSSVSTTLVLTEPTAKWRYEGKTVALLDYHAQSQAETTLLALGSVGATLIGSPTVGGIGSSTGMMLPGGFNAGFPTGEWRWPDGRSITRVGIQPKVLVRPTIAGVRAGRDEVLERAVTYLKACLPSRCN